MTMCLNNSVETIKYFNKTVIFIIIRYVFLKGDMYFFVRVNFGFQQKHIFVNLSIVLQNKTANLVRPYNSS